jgi:putative transcriptional regulator
MKMTNEMTDEAILAELGERLAKVRLDRNLMQAGLADKAGVSKRTVERLEAGESIQLAGFVRVCRALDLVGHFEAFIPEPAPSPIAQLKLRGRVRRRASPFKVAEDAPGKWTWGTQP